MYRIIKMTKQSSSASIALARLRLILHQDRVATGSRGRSASLGDTGSMVMLPIHVTVGAGKCQPKT